MCSGAFGCRCGLQEQEQREADRAGTCAGTRSCGNCELAKVTRRAGIRALRDKDPSKPERLRSRRSEIQWARCEESGTQFSRQSGWEEARRTDRAATVLSSP